MIFLTVKAYSIGLLYLMVYRSSNPLKPTQPFYYFRNHTMLTTQQSDGVTLEKLSTCVWLQVYLAEYKVWLQHRERPPIYVTHCMTPGPRLESTTWPLIPHISLMLWNACKIQVRGVKRVQVGAWPPFDQGKRSNTFLLTTTKSQIFRFSFLAERIHKQTKVSSIHPLAVFHILFLPFLPFSSEVCWASSTVHSITSFFVLFWKHSFIYAFNKYIETNINYPRFSLL